MAFITVEDLYGSCEIIVFETCYNNCSNILMEESLIMVDGRVSIKDETDITIIANSITELKSISRKHLEVVIDNLSDAQKERLKGAINFFTGDKNNIALHIIEADEEKAKKPIFANDDVINEFREIVGEENLKLVEE